MATFSDKGHELVRLMNREEKVLKKLEQLKGDFEAECLLAEIQLAKEVSRISDSFECSLNELEADAEACSKEKLKVQQELVSMSTDKNTGMVIINGEASGEISS